MSLTMLATELLCMVSDELDLCDHSSLTLTSRHLAAVLQPRLLSKLQRLPLQDPTKYAPLAIHWAAASSNNAKLKILLETTCGVTIIDTTCPTPPTTVSASRRRRFPPPPPSYITPFTPAPATLARLFARGPYLFLIGPTTSKTPYWSRRPQTAPEFALTTNHFGLLRLSTSDEPNLPNALRVLRYAARRGSPAASRILLDSFLATFGPAAFESAQQEWLQLVILCRSARFFLNDGATAALRDSAGRTLLHRAVTGAVLGPPGQPAGVLSHEDAVHSVLLLRGIVVDARDAQGKTALHLAAEAGFVEVVDLLLRAGAIPDVVDGEGAVAVHVACRGGAERRWEVVAVLQKYGADLGLRDAQGVVARDLITGPRETRSRRGKK